MNAGKTDRNFYFRLRVPHGLENFLAQTHRRCRTALRAARWAHPPTRTRKRHQDIATAVAAMEPSKAVSFDAAQVLRCQHSKRHVFFDLLRDPSLAAS